MPFCTDVLTGVTEIVKSPTWVTTSVTPAVRVNPPLVPRMVSAYVPAGVDADVDTDSADEPDATTDAGLNVAVAPDGRPVTEKATVPVKPDPGVAVAVYPALSPGATDTEAGEPETEKSATVIVLVCVVLVSPPLSVTLKVAV